MVEKQSKYESGMFDIWELFSFRWCIEIGQVNEQNETPKEQFFKVPFNHEILYPIHQYSRTIKVTA